METTPSGRNSADESMKTEEPSSSEEKVNWSEFLDPELVKDVGCNPTGQYELCAVLTHVGRSADSGKLKKE